MDIFVLLKTGLEYLAWGIFWIAIAFVALIVVSNAHQSAEEANKRRILNERFAQWQKQQQEAEQRKEREVAAEQERKRLAEWREELSRRQEEADRENDRRYRAAGAAMAQGLDVCLTCLTVEPSRCYCGNCNTCHGGTSSGCNVCD